MIIDAHVHYNSDTEEIVPSAEKNGIDKICVSLGNFDWTHNPSIEKIRKCNNAVIKLMKRSPDVVIGFCYLNPKHGNASIKELARCIKEGMRGIKLWVACKASDKRVFPIAEEAVKHDMPVLYHAWNKVTGNYPDESTPEDICILAEKFPKLKIIMAHLTGAGYKGILDIKRYKNIFLDTSGGYPAVAITQYAIRELGAERIVFGSDAPGRNFAVQLGRIYGADISAKDKRLILGANIKRILKI